QAEQPQQWGQPEQQQQWGQAEQPQQWGQPEQQPEQLSDLAQGVISVINMGQNAVDQQPSYPQQ
ncbi:MAG: hypothetical protein II022_00115, partial [Muribaculaceae bacterium]|nr:hypothetical protein [Muribaculaceae bacterium]